MACLFKRNDVYYLFYFEGAKRKKVSLHTDVYNIALEKKRQLESAIAQGKESPLPTKTPLAEVVSNYIQNMRAKKTAKSAQTDTYYLKVIFGVICPELENNSRKNPESKNRKPLKHNQSGNTISVKYLEDITTIQIASFVSEQVRSKGLAPKTANRYREIICRLFNWAMSEGGVRMPNDKNPAAQVEKYREKAPEISFLTLSQIDEQLEKLKDAPQMQTMVAMFIYAGLRREELLWLTRDDIDLKRGMIRVRAKTVNGEFWEPKTKVNRAVPISKALRIYLNQYKPKPSIGGWYFPSPGGVHYDPDNFSRDLRNLNDKARLKWACLDYRHTFGSQLAMKGESLYKISKLMGNSPEICRKHYAAIIPESLMNCVDFGQPLPVAITG